VRRRKSTLSILDLKKIKRLSHKDRSALIHSIKRNKKFKEAMKSSKELSKVSAKIGKGVLLSAGSDSSATQEDWKNWIVLHGKKEEVDDDVRRLGKMIGVKC